MNSRLPPMRPQPDGFQDIKLENNGPYGMPDVMLNGITKIKSEVRPTHPLEFSEKHWAENAEKMEFTMLRKSQGIAAPLKIQMERNIATKIGRAPCLHSSNLMSDILTGRLDTMEFEDFLNNPADAEIMGQPHLMAEKRAGLL